MISYPNMDPVIFSLGPLAIRWYGVAYLAGILGAWGWLVFLLKRLPLHLQKSPTMAAHHLPKEFIPWMVLGIVLGGRLGEALFYHPTYYMAKPWEILYIWRPGMSFHGGLLGVLVAGFFVIKKHGLYSLRLMDLLGTGAPIGLFFGRLANFVNAELVGRPTTVPWAMVFPGTDGLARHPSQLYEAFLEGVLPFIVLNLLYVKAKWYQHPGRVAGAFGLLYGTGRFISEYYREPDGFVPFLWEGLTLGQAYTLPMFLAGALLMALGFRRSSSTLVP